jgi:hypothetical protein
MLKQRAVFKENFPSASAALPNQGIHGKTSVDQVVAHAGMNWQAGRLALGTGILPICAGNFP